MEKGGLNSKITPGRLGGISEGFIALYNLMEKRKWSILFSLCLLLACFGEHSVAEGLVCPIRDGTLTEWTGYVQSANFGVSDSATYTNDQRCQWLILMTHGSRVRLTSLDFQLEPPSSRGECYDFLKVHDGVNGTAPLIGIYCGSQFPAEMVSPSRSLFLEFETDHTNAFKGFRIDYTGVCSGVTVNVPIEGSGYIESPLYPADYPSAITCDWILETEPGYRVDVDFEFLTLSSSSDCADSSIQFYDGRSSASSMLGEFCGSEIQPVSSLHDVSSTTNVMFLSFRGDTEAAQEFRLVYSTEMLACTRSPCENGATCHNIDLDFSCDCAPGWAGKTCGENIDECNPWPCGDHGSDCEDIVNGFICTCVDGYEGALCDVDIDECTDHLCQNGATCIDGINEYSCACPTGYMGPFCDEVDHCSDIPCQHGGTCQNSGGTFSCSCVDGYEGEQCEIDTDECGSSPCENGGTCTDGINGYVCTCPGFTGAQCQTEIDECASSPCGQQGSCEDLINSYSCRCVPGFVGVNCEANFDECGSDPCQHGSTCIDLDNGYQCACVPGYDGDDCEINIDECASTPCANGGSCQDNVDGYMCSCVAGYEGVTCQTDIDECDSNPCQNDAVCNDAVNGYTCDCLAGYQGIHCEEDIDECASDPCQHGATCSDGVNGYRCECAPGYDGTHCENDIDECSGDPCQNDAACLDTVNGYTCDCLAGYRGTFCEENIDECASDPCQHSATCSDEVNEYLCECAPGYDGIHCENDIDDCAGNPCQNDAACTDAVDGYACNCLAGYQGIHCEEDIDECASDPCQHGATCSDEVNRYQCECSPGYNGTHCENDINECSTDPCRNGGMCTDEVNGYTCSCRAGYDGRDCQEDINECGSDPCQNGAACEDLVNEYMCNCLAGYQGTNCEEEVNECSSNPCLNSGSCVDLVDKYRCECVEGFIGDRCEAEDVKAICVGGLDGVEGSGLVWDDTEPGQTNIKPCPEGANGNASRWCDFTAQWSNPDLSKCISPAFAEISGKAELLKSGNASASEVLDLATSLQNITEIPGPQGGEGSKQIYPGDMEVATNSLNIISEVVGSVEDLDVGTAKDLTQACTGTINNLVDESQLHAWKNTNNPEKVATSVTTMISSTEAMADVVGKQQAKHLGSDSSEDTEDSALLIKDKNIELQVSVFLSNQTDLQDEFLAGVQELDKNGLPLSSIVLPEDLLDAADEANASGSGYVGVMKGKFRSVGQLFGLADDKGKNESRKDYINSDVLSLKVLGLSEDKFQNLETPVVLVFKHTEEVDADNISCVFLNMSAESSDKRWSDFGCELQSTNETHTVCVCSHLTNFAILMDVHGSQAKLHESHNTALSILSYIGGTLSILGCVFSIAIYQFFRLKSDRIRVHMHLAAAIAVAQLIFLVGIERTEIEWVCKMIAALLHYALTAMFAWMLVEGIQLYLALVHVFGSSSHIKKYFLLGWGAPLIIVGISFGVFFKDYGSGAVCWMTQKMLLIVFVPTVAIMIILNTAVLIIVLKVMMTSLTAKEKSKDSDTSQIKNGLKAALVLLPLLGLTWVFGFMSVNEYTLVFTYLFAICNSLQGLFFFIAHCVMNIEVKKAYERRYGRKKGLHSMTTNSSAPLSSRSEISSRKCSETTELTKRKSSVSMVSGGGCDNPAMKDTSMNNTTDTKKTATDAVKVNDIQCLVKNSEKVSDEEKGLVEGAKVAMKTIVSKDTNLKMDGSNLA